MMGHVKGDNGGCWTEERVEKLKELWEGGLSACAISTLLGPDVSRNAVIGKAHRLSLSARKPGYRHIIGPRLRKKLSVKRPRKRLPRQITPDTAPEPFEFTVSAWEPLAGSTPVALVDLREGMCKWEIGGTNTSPGYGFCGCATVKGSVYCEEHRARSVGKGTRSERKAVDDAVQFARAA